MRRSPPDILAAVCMFAAAWVTGLSASSCGSSAGTGFDDPGSPGGTTRIHGFVSAPDSDRPTEETTAVFALHDGTIAETTTDELGNFRFDSVPAGPARFVANDGLGHGALMSRTLYAGGTNRVGELQLRPVGEIDALAGLRGVGFEERLSSASGDWDHPLYSPDASRVYVGHETASSPGFDVVEIATSSGERTILLENEWLRTLDGWSPDGPGRLFELVDDRYLFLSRHADGGPRRVVYDVKADQIVFDSLSVGARAYSEPIVMAEAVVMILEHDSAPIREEDGSTTGGTAEKLRLHVLDLESGTVRSGPDTGSTWSKSLYAVAAESGRVVLRITTPCSNSKGFVVCESTAAGWRRADYRLYDVGRGEITTLMGPSWGQGPYGRDFRRVGVDLVPDGSQVLLLYTGIRSDQYGTRSAIVRRDFGSDYTTRERQFERNVTADVPVRVCAGCRPVLLGASDASTVLLTSDGWNSDSPGGNGTAVRENVRVDLDSGRTTPIRPLVRIDGHDENVCNRGCDVRMVEDSTVRFRSKLRDSSGNVRGAIVDYRHDTIVDRTVIDIADDAGRFDAPLLRASRADVRAIRLRRETSGPAQYFVRGGPRSGATSRFVRRTFLPGVHHRGRLSPDGQTLFFSRRDPRTDRDRLFRLELGTLPDGVGIAERRESSDG